MAYARRTDQNLAPIVAGLREIPGLTVLVTNAEVDFIVGYRRVNYLFELKRPERRGRVQPRQRKLAATWAGQYAIVSTFTDVLRTIGLLGDDCAQDAHDP